MFSVIVSYSLHLVSYLHFIMGMIRRFGYAFSSMLFDTVRSERERTGVLGGIWKVGVRLGFFVSLA